MIVLEFKAYPNQHQEKAIKEAIRTAQFVQNKCLRYWMDSRGVAKKEIFRYNTSLRAEFPFVKDLNSHACQVSVERTWSAILRFYANCKLKVAGKKGYPKFKKNARSVEYKVSGWKLSNERKHITFTDKKGIGRLKLKGGYDLHFYDIDQIKRVRIVRRADGYYVQFCVRIERTETIEPSGNAIGLDVGLKEFYTDSNGNAEPNPRFYRLGEERIRFHQRRVSRKKRTGHSEVSSDYARSKKKGSANRSKAINRLSRQHLKISRQRKDHAVKLARCVVQSNDLIAYEDLRVRNLVKNYCLAKSINDVGWYQFRAWLEYFSKVFGKVTVAVNPAYTSQNCSSCGTTVKKSLSTRTHACQCGCTLDRDHNAAINILNRALSTVGHTGTNASGDLASIWIGENLSKQAGSMKEESPRL
ncbi:transposase [Lusitaniella coriacea LEGE 07157]|uniref:Transposase n=1 Tax=Lusitaniella coriacea LEGE 07157 TaxID=945747 RepID=A0A8J7E0Q0_9CYAN|nr:RNA-guided endonuclease TnpB family protein [Lusitaniella coriacea]MBE9118351.1 transposase [Lusitaniella coriacea LEGE 07157]